MELKQIYTSDTEYYSFTERLMTESFPANEYRDLCDFRKYTDSNPLLHNNIIFETTISVKLLNIKPNLTASVYFTCICVMNYYALLVLTDPTNIDLFL